jgi:tellurite resistance protein
MSGPTPEYRAVVEAGVGICTAVIMADGKVSQDEARWFMAQRMAHPLFRDVPADAFKSMQEAVQAQLAGGGWKPLVEKWAVAVPDKFRSALFELACAVATVDKDLAGKEPEVVRHLGKALGFADDVIRKTFMDSIEKM